MIRKLMNIYSISFFICSPIAASVTFINHTDYTVRVTMKLAANALKQNAGFLDFFKPSYWTDTFITEEIPAGKTVQAYDGRGGCKINYMIEKKVGTTSAEWVEVYNSRKKTTTQEKDNPDYVSCGNRIVTIYSKFVTEPAFKEVWRIEDRID